MNRTVKSLVIALCFAVCGAGAVLVPVNSPPTGRQQPGAMPVRNHEAARGLWIEV
jgi:hypothetical protein